MSDDEPDLELLQLLRETLGLTGKTTTDELSSDTGVLRDAEYIYNNATDVSIDMWGTKSAAKKLWKIMQDRSGKLWSDHDLHPSLKEGFTEIDLLNFVFTMTLLNFCFWSELDQTERFQIEYQGRTWTGYMSLVAALRRALDEKIPITTPRFWRSPACSDDVIRHVFRSATVEEMPLLEERIAHLREAADALEQYDDAVEEEPVLSTHAHDLDLQAAKPPATMSSAVEQAVTERARAAVNEPQAVVESEADSTVSTPADRQPAAGDGVQPAGDHVAKFNTSLADRSVERFIAKADHSAGKMVNLLVKEIPSFRDECRYESRKVRILKRAQIFVGDLHGAFNGEGLGSFTDMDHLTMFADYRVPQILQNLGVLSYCPALDAHIRRGEVIPSRSSWEVQLRGCSIFATELLRREIVREGGDAARAVNAVQIDFLLYDLAKENELLAIEGSMPHHRTRSTNY